MSIETQLREALSARADEVSRPAFDPYERVTGAIAASRRRRRTAAVAALAAVTAVAVAVPVLTRGGDRTTSPATHHVPSPSDPAWRSLSTWPTRGSLAGDTDLVKAVADRGAGRVIFVDDVGSHRVVLLVRPGLRQLALLDGPAGAAVDDLGETSTVPGSGDPTPGAVTFTVDDSQLVVVASPELSTVEVSGAPDIRADGSVRRTWRALHLRAGLGSIDVTSSLVRVRAGGYDGPATFAVRRPPAREDSNASVCLDLCADFDSRATAATSATVARTLNVPSDDVATTVVYSGPVNASLAGAYGVTEASRGRLRLFVANSRLPGGQVLRSALLVHSNGDGTGESIDLQTGVPVDAKTAHQRPLVLHVLDPATEELFLQVFAPSAARVMVTSDAPATSPDSARQPVIGGSAVIRVHHGANLEGRQVVTYDRSGREIGRWPVELDHADDPYDLGPSVPAPPIAEFTPPAR